MAVVDATDLISHDEKALKGNRYEFGVVCFVVEFINVNYKSLPVLLRHFIIGRVCRGHITSICRILRVAMVAS